MTTVSEAPKLTPPKPVEKDYYCEDNKPLYPTFKRQAVWPTGGGKWGFSTQIHIEKPVHQNTWNLVLTFNLPVLKIETWTVRAVKTEKPNMWILKGNAGKIPSQIAFNGETPFTNKNLNAKVLLCPGLFERIRSSAIF